MIKIMDWFSCTIFDCTQMDNMRFPQIKGQSVLEGCSINHNPLLLNETNAFGFKALFNAGRPG